MVYLVVYHIKRKTTTQGMLLNIVSVERINIMLPPFALLHNDSNQNSCGNVSKISVNQAVRWLQISLATKTTIHLWYGGKRNSEPAKCWIDRIFENTAT